VAAALAQFERAHSEQQAPFDIVFADIGMPRMDGYELAQCLGALPSGAKMQRLQGRREPDENG